MKSNICIKHHSINTHLNTFSRCIVTNVCNTVEISVFAFFSETLANSTCFHKLIIIRHYIISFTLTSSTSGALSTTTKTHL